MTGGGRWEDTEGRFRLAFAILCALAFADLWLPFDLAADGLGVPLAVALPFLLFLTPVWLAPFVPLVLAGWRTLRGPLPVPLAVVAALHVVLAIPFAVLASVMTGIAGIPGNPLLPLAHIALVCVGVRVGASWAFGENRWTGWRTGFGARVAAVTAGAFLSLLGAFVVVGQSALIADGRPYCVARHDAERAVRSLGEVRLFSFYTTATGYKSTSRWWFHGVLTVDDPTGTRYYNWSPRLFRFDRIERPYVQLQPVTDLCEPSKSFWRDVLLARAG